MSSSSSRSRVNFISYFCYECEEGEHAAAAADERRRKKEYYEEKKKKQQGEWSGHYHSTSSSSTGPKGPGTGERERNPNSGNRAGVVGVEAQQEKKNGSQGRSSSSGADKQLGGRWRRTEGK